MFILIVSKFDQCQEDKEEVKAEIIKEFATNKVTKIVFSNLDQDPIELS